MSDLINEMPKDSVLIYNYKSQDYQLFVQSVGRTKRFSGEVIYKNNDGSNLNTPMDLDNTRF